LIHDVAIQNLPVLFAIDRAGVVGGDGSTHNGTFDLSYLRCIPNMIVMTPADENEMRNMLYTGYLLNAPVAVRYPRGSVIGVSIDKTLQNIPLGKAEIRREGKDIAILSFGTQLKNALTVGEQLNATVVNMRFVKPLDEALIADIVASHSLIVTLEENAILGGAGSAVNEVLARQNNKMSLLNLGLPDEYIEHGDSQVLLAECGLSVEGIMAVIKKRREEMV
jgi:1-deoxy-D-xylulose-5-phosphate synthase